MKLVTRFIPKFSFISEIFLISEVEIYPEFLFVQKSIVKYFFAQKLLFIKNMLFVKKILCIQKMLFVKKILCIQKMLFVQKILFIQKLLFIQKKLFIQKMLSTQKSLFVQTSQFDSTYLEDAINADICSQDTLKK